MRFRKAYIFILLLVVASFFALQVNAEEETSGTWGYNLTWSYNPQNATLTIEGTGEMHVSPMGNYPWKPYASVVKQVVLPEGLTLIEERAFRDFTELEEVNIPTTVNVIDDYAFYNCSSLKSILIPGSVATIDGQAFAKCVALESVTIEPGKLFQLGTEAFEGCKSLKEIYLPDNLSSIHNGVFNNCTALESVRFPKEYHGALINFFDRCVNLKKIYLDSETSVRSFIDFNDTGPFLPLYLDYVFLSESSVKNFQCVPTSGDKVLCEVVNGVTYYGYARDEKKSVINHQLERYSVLEDCHSAACLYCYYSTDFVPHDYMSSTIIDEYSESKLTTYYCSCGHTKTVTEPLYDDKENTDDSAIASAKLYITVFTAVFCGVMLVYALNSILLVVIIRAVIKKHRNNEKTSE